MPKKRKKTRKKPPGAAQAPHTATPTVKQRIRQAASPAMPDGMFQLSDARRTAVMSQAETASRLAGLAPDTVKAMFGDFHLYKRLLQQYNDALVKIGVACSREELDAMDVIDMRGLAARARMDSTVDIPPPSELVDETPYMDYVRSEPMLYQVLPCFESGVIRLNTDRYFEFRLNELDIDAGRIWLYLHDYTYRADQNLWEPGIYGVLEITCNMATNEIRIAGKDSDLMTFDRIYRLLDMKSLGWDNRARQLWKNTAVAQADAFQASKRTDEQNQVVELGRLFIMMVTISNYYLNTRKPVLAKGQRRPAKPKPGHKAGPNETTPDAPESGQAPRRLVRTIGPIRIISAKAPKPAGAATIRKYRVASWTTRGHVRRYKSGKTVYVKPATHHRKALAGRTDPAAPRPQSVIQFDPSLNPGKAGSPTEETQKGD